MSNYVQNQQNFHQTEEGQLDCINQSGCCWISGCLKQQKFVVSQFWKPRVQDEGVDSWESSFPSWQMASFALHLCVACVPLS